MEWVDIQIKILKPYWPDRKMNTIPHQNFCSHLSPPFLSLHSSTISLSLSLSLSLSSSL